MTRRHYSLSFLTCLDAPPPEAIRTARATGYDCIGLRLHPAAPGGVSFPLMDDPAAMQDTLAALRDTGIEVFDVEIVRIGPGFAAAAYEGFLEAASRLGARSVLVAGDDPGSPAPLSLISTTTVFGTPIDVTLAELALECFYPADDATRITLLSQAM